MDAIIRLLNILVHLYKPIIRNTVLFRSFYGQYNDNPKYISEELHRRLPETKIVWAIRDGRESDYPEYVELVPLNSLAYIKYLTRAQVVIDNYYGCRSAIVDGRNIFKRSVSAYKARKRYGQFRLSTWHGTPLKKIVLDEPKYHDKKRMKIYTSTDVLLAGDMLMANAFRTALNWRKEIAMYGTPRNDLLFQCNDDLRNNLKRKLGLPLEKKVVLFAPTFRESIKMSGLTQIENLDIDCLCQTLSKKFGGEWCFVFRSHNEVMKQVVESYKKAANIINGNLYPDMAEYLACCDVLITDYSGSMFDYALTKKPCFLYTPDLSYYQGIERGFYLDIRSLPFSVSETVTDLIESIKNFEYDKYQRGIDDMLFRIGSVEDGNAAVRVVDRIEHFFGTVNNNKAR